MEEDRVAEEARKMEEDRIAEEERRAALADPNSWEGRFGNGGVGAVEPEGESGATLEGSPKDVEGACWNCTSHKVDCHRPG